MLMIILLKPHRFDYYLIMIDTNKIFDKTDYFNKIKNNTIVPVEHLKIQ